MSQSASLRVVCLAGPSDSGKTTLVERLVSRLSADGTRVATVKSIHHDIEIDTPGTDTHRHRTAGAETVVGITPELTFDVSTRGKRDPPSRSEGGDAGFFATDPDDSDYSDDSRERELQALASTLERLARREYDVVLVEGFGTSPLPTILVGDRDPKAVGGDVVGRGDDDLEDLLETIRSIETLPVGSDTDTASSAGQ